MTDDHAPTVGPRRTWAIATAVVVAPLVVAVTALAFRPWVPVLDLAMTELRVRDVGGRHTPLIGLPGRIGEFPDQGSHPGPWSFVMIAPWYRLAGASAWGMELGSVVVNVAAVAGIVELGRRRHGPVGILVYAALAAIAVRGYGIGVLTHPWNPYFPVLLWLLAVLAAAHVLAGGIRWAPVVTGASVVAAQTHIPYLVSAIALNALVIGALLWRRRRGDTEAARWALISIAVAAVLWVPPAVDQLRNGADGNIAKSIRHFATEPPEAAIGLGEAAAKVTQHLDLVRIATGLVTSDTALVDRAGAEGWSLGGLVVLALWAAAAVWAVRARDAGLLATHAVAVTCLVAGWVSIARIFGKVWFYLTLWMSATALLVALTLAWTAVELVRRRSAERGGARPTRVDATVAGLAVTVVGVTTLLSTVVAVGQRPPEEDFGEDVAAIIDDVEAALVASEVGPDGRFLLRWQESVVSGSQGYAMLNELERRGVDVGVDPPFRIPARPHRVETRPDAVVHFVSGPPIERWRTLGYDEVVTYDGRTDDELERAARLEASVTDALRQLGRDDLVEMAAENLFRASLQPGVPRPVVEQMDELMRIGRPISVFVEIVVDGD